MSSPACGISMTVIVPIAPTTNPILLFMFLHGITLTPIAIVSLASDHLINCSPYID